MLKIISLLTIFLIAIIGCKHSTSKKITVKDQAELLHREIQLISKPQILITSSNTGAQYESFLKQNDITKVGFINDSQFLDKTKSFTCNLADLQKEIARAYPDPLEKGIAYIDLESPYLEYLMDKPVESAEFKKSQKLFLDILSIAKKERPNVKWGYYYLPFTTYWGRDRSFYEKHLKVKQIIEKSDVLFPSIYIFYNNVDFYIENNNYLKENTEEVIRIAAIYNKPVYPMIMTRYHPSNKVMGNEMINTVDFRDYVNTLFNTSYAQNKVDGVVLWNADDYAYRIREKKIMQEFVEVQQ